MDSTLNELLQNIKEIHSEEKSIEVFAQYIKYSIGKVFLQDTAEAVHKLGYFYVLIPVSMFELKTRRKGVSEDAKRSLQIVRAFILQRAEGFTSWEKTVKINRKTIKRTVVAG